MAITSGSKARPSDLGAGGAKPQGILARGNRTTSSSTTTTEVGVLRVDNIPIVAGRAYPVWTCGLYLISSVASDLPEAKVRYSTSGVATTASTILAKGEDQVTSGTQPVSTIAQGVYVATVTGTLSLILTVSRSAGTGSVSIFGTSELFISDAGVDPGDTGVDL